MTKEYILCPKYNRPIFELEYEESVTDYRIDIIVKEVICWDTDGSPLNNPMDPEEIYLKVGIKWDGCSHFNFGDEGYLHLCGKYHLDNHKILIDKLWEMAGRLVKHWDKEVAE